MASIRSFRAIRPNQRMMGTYYSNYQGEGCRLPSKEEVISYSISSDREVGPFDDVGPGQRMLCSGRYELEEDKAIYIYETKNAAGLQHGVWTLTAVEDYTKGDILPHEHTIAWALPAFDKFAGKGKLEGEPVVLFYRDHPVIERLIERAKAEGEQVSYFFAQQRHRLWKVSDESLVMRFALAFAALGRVYVADGHHRIRAASENRGSGDWLSSLYLSDGNLSIGAQHRVVVPKEHNPDRLMAHLEKLFYISPIPNNKPFRPGQKNRFGLCLMGRWFQLDLRGEHSPLAGMADVRLLQEQVFEKLFGITDPSVDGRLRCFDDGEGWGAMLSLLSSEPGAIGFTLYAMEAAEIMGQVDCGVILPPKSTYISPRVPYGLLMHCEGVASGVRQGELG